jgi:hypothetical protein
VSGFCARSRPPVKTNATRKKMPFMP